MQNPVGCLGHVQLLLVVDHILVRAFLRQRVTCASPVPQSAQCLQCRLRHTCPSSLRTTSHNEHVHSPLLGTRQRHWKSRVQFDHLGHGWLLHHKQILWQHLPYDDNLELLPLAEAFLCEPTNLLPIFISLKDWANICDGVFQPASCNKADNRRCCRLTFAAWQGTLLARARRHAQSVACQKGTCLVHVHGHRSEPAKLCSFPSVRMQHLAPVPEHFVQCSLEVGRALIDWVRPTIPAETKSHLLRLFRLVNAGALQPMHHHELNLTGNKKKLRTIRPQLPDYRACSQSAKFRPAQESSTSTIGGVGFLPVLRQAGESRKHGSRAWPLVDSGTEPAMTIATGTWMAYLQSKSEMAENATSAATTSASASDHGSIAISSNN